jgi:1-acyl-sn-glycerol-3-phosphate acyltransferase
MTAPVVLIPQPARFLTWLAVGKVKVVGEVPKGAALLCANHASYRDVWLFTLICPSARLLVHPEVFTFPFLKRWATRKGFVQVSIDDAVTLLRRGEPVAICPTGLVEARSENELPFKTGAIRIAQQAAVPVVPVYFRYGTYPGRWISKFSITVQNILLFLLWPFYRTGVTILIGTPYVPMGEVKAETNALKVKVVALAGK